MFHAAHRAVRAAIGVSAIAVMVASAPIVQAQKATGPAQPSNGVTPNYELAAAWTTQKVSRLVFDTSVTPRWLDTSDRFWYSYNTREGRRFMLVDPIKKTKTPLFDHAKMAAALTMITRIPYDAQHLPFTQVRFIKNDAAFEFEVQVPRDAVIPTTKPKAITTDQQGGAGGGGDEQTNEFDMVEDPLQQGQQTATATAAAARSGRSRNGCRSRPGHGGAAHEDAALRVRHGDRQDDARRGLSRGAAPSGLGLAVTGREDRPVRAQSQPLHDGRGELGEGPEVRQRQDDRRDTSSRPTARSTTASAAAAVAAAVNSNSSNRSRTTSRVRTRISRRSRARTPRTSAFAPATWSGPPIRASSRWFAAIRAW